MTTKYGRLLGFIVAMGFAGMTLAAAILLGEALILIYFLGAFALAWSIGTAQRMWARHPRQRGSEIDQRLAKLWLVAPYAICFTLILAIWLRAGAKGGLLFSVGAGFAAEGAIFGGVFGTFPGTSGSRSVDGTASSSVDSTRDDET